MTRCTTHDYLRRATFAASGDNGLSCQGSGSVLAGHPGKATPAQAEGRVRLRVMHTAAMVIVAAMLAFVMPGCSREDGNGATTKPAAKPPVATTDTSGPGQVTVHGDDRIAKSLTWDVPDVTLAADDIDAARKRAAAALKADHLYEDADAAIPLYLAILQQAPGDDKARTGLQDALKALLADGDKALADAGDDVGALRQAHVIASVARAIAGQAIDGQVVNGPAVDGKAADGTTADGKTANDKAANASFVSDDQAAKVQAYLGRVDVADQLWVLNRQGDRALRAGRLGESGGGALAKFRAALRLRPDQPRALRGLAAVEDGLIDRAMATARTGDFDGADKWLAQAAKIRPGSDTIPEAHERVAGVRRALIAQLRDEGLVALQQKDIDIPLARSKLANMLRIAEPGDPAAALLRERIDLVSHYGLFRPGQAFTDALENGARGPEMVVVPHGAFRMGAEEDAEGTSENEHPAHYVRFDRGFAMSRTEVTVGEFRRFVTASGYEPTATKRGNSFMYLERNGSFVRRGNVDWQSAYNGSRAADDLPVVHVSLKDAEAYARWLAEQSGERYRLASEAEFEYALRAGSKGRYPWGDGVPPAGTGNFTGAKDKSPNGRRWRNAFAGYGDGYWGPAPVGHFAANAFGLHDLAGNVSEWVADCWHDGYRRAPDDGGAWVNPGCRERVIRGGAWASAPEQVRSTWRTPVEGDTTNARIGFRVVREL